MKISQQAMKAVRATTKTGIVVTREAVKTNTAAIKTAIAAAQNLAAAITAGGWAMIGVVLIICMVGLLIASPYGTFFSNSDSTDTITPITLENKTVEHPVSENKAAWTETVLTITIKARTPDDMRVFYQLSDQQNSFLDDLLAEENSSLWDNLLTGSSEEIVSIALSQVGNIGGQPYWSWYGFDSHVNWCACFVSWCANECGYIQAGIIPRFASCTAGSNWFKARDLWKPRSATPDVGDLVFFDWDTDGLPDHVGIVECVKDEADLLHVSRQNVNQIKKRDEKKLRKRLS